MTSSTENLRLVLVGTGQIAAEIVRCALAQRHEIVGAVDVDPAKVGRDLGELIGLEPLGVNVVDSIEELPEDAHVAIVATSSLLERSAPQLRACMERGLDVVSTCEELAYPWPTQPELASALDAEARGQGVTLVGAGINPGFVMDSLAIFATAPCSAVRHVLVRRELDAGKRRSSFRDKVGAGGIDEQEYRARAATGEFGHAGLAASAWMVADKLGLGADRADESIEPVITDGDVVGTQQYVSLLNGDTEVVRLEMVMALGVKAAQDAITIDADPPLRYVVEGGVPGDAGTAGVVVNAACRVGAAAAGLLTVADLPLVHVTAGKTRVPAGEAESR